MNENTLKQKKKLGISVGLLIILSNVAGILISLLLNKLNVQTEQNKYLVTYIVNAISIYVIAFTVFKLILKKVERVENNEKKKLKFWEFILFICITIGGTQFVNLIFQMFLMIVRAVFHIEINNNVAELLQNSNPVISLIFAVILAPVFEELIFRGTLLKRLRVYGDKTAILYTAIMFGLFHCNIEQLPYTIACGLILGYAYTKTNNIVYPITFHIIMNGFSVLLSTFLMYEMTMAMIVQELVLIILIVLSLVFVPILLTSGKVKITNDNAVYEKKNLYKNVGFIFTAVISAVFTIIAMIKF